MRWRDRDETRRRFQDALVLLAVCCFALCTGFAALTESDPGPQRAWVIERLAPRVQPLSSGDASYFEQASLRAGDSYGSLLRRLRISDIDTSRLLVHPAVTSQLSALPRGTVLTASLQRDGSLQSIRFMSDADEQVDITPGGDIAIRPGSLREETTWSIAPITSNAYEAMDSAAFPPSIARSLQEIFGGELDFHSDLHAGDRISAIYTRVFDKDVYLHPGRVLAAEIMHQGHAHRAFWYASPGRSGYYADTGRNLRRAFLRSPLVYSRISSGFELRFDPWLHTWINHRGIDFAAPLGVAVSATADGDVAVMRFDPSYGNVVMLNHAGGITTVYAHLSGFAPGLKVGDRVGQGRLLGFVGQTGWATGPHLHYEFRVNGVHVDPLGVQVERAEPIDFKHLEDFERQMTPMRVALQRLNGSAAMVLAAERER